MNISFKKPSSDPQARAHTSRTPALHGHPETAPVSRVAARALLPESATRQAPRRHQSGGSLTATLRDKIWHEEWMGDLEPLIPDAIEGPHKSGRNIVVFQPPQVPEEKIGTGRPLSEAPMKGIIVKADARAMSPREMQNLSLDLYVSGVLAWDEYEDLAFQPELHPDFGRTIGALTGERPLPDQPRDFIREWEQKLDFERRFAPAKSRAKERALRILSVLRRIEPSKLSFSS
ncbi:hypothetical protein V5T82_17125 [Magnetovibrio sp. PR-2]|uniref:hypothetical protein n=1 Tax=Magnetovibrio sp. PR-2 TaxID=3120356 RepID=UPI002FCE5CEA